MLFKGCDESCEYIHDGWSLLYDGWFEQLHVFVDHPSYSAEECFQRIDKKIKTYLRQKHVPLVPFTLLSFS